MPHQHAHVDRQADRRRLKAALALVLAFMAVEVTVGILASSLALLSDAAHMLTDAGALAISLLAARLADWPARGSMTYGLGRAEIVSTGANGVTFLILGALIVYGALTRLVSPPAVRGGPMLAVALAGVAVNLLATRILAAPVQGKRSLNVEGSFQHIVTDLYGFAATAVAAIVILGTEFVRADAIASLLIAALMLHAAYRLLQASGRVFMEAAPAGLDPARIGHELACQAGVVEVHDLHVWEVTSGFPALSAHVLVRAESDGSEVRTALERVLMERFDIHHTTLQVEQEPHPQAPLQIEIPRRAGAAHAEEGDGGTGERG